VRRINWIIPCLLLAYSSLAYLMLWAGIVLVFGGFTVRLDLRAQAISVLVGVGAMLLHMWFRNRASPPRRGFDVLSRDRRHVED
jgi:hypothetical protein